MHVAKCVCKYCYLCDGGQCMVFFFKDFITLLIELCSKKIRPLFLYLTYELIQIFITFKRTGVSTSFLLFKQVYE